jgi:hypothetical protein
VGARIGAGCYSCHPRMIKGRVERECWLPSTLRGLDWGCMVKGRTHRVLCFMCMRIGGWLEG